LKVTSVVSTLGLAGEASSAGDSRSTAGEVLRKAFVALPVDETGSGAQMEIALQGRIIQ